MADLDELVVSGLEVIVRGGKRKKEKKKKKKESPILGRGVLALLVDFDFGRERESLK
jgi:hypothetical protein